MLMVSREDEFPPCPRCNCVDITMWDLADGSAKSYFCENCYHEYTVQANTRRAMIGRASSTKEFGKEQGTVPAVSWEAEYHRLGHIPY